METNICVSLLCRNVEYDIHMKNNKILKNKTLCVCFSLHIYIFFTEDVYIGDKWLEHIPHWFLTRGRSEGYVKKWMDLIPKKHSMWHCVNISYVRERFLQKVQVICKHGNLWYGRDWRGPRAIIWMGVWRRGRRLGWRHTRGVLLASCLINSSRGPTYFLTSHQQTQPNSPFQGYQMVPKESDYWNMLFYISKWIECIPFCMSLFFYIYVFLIEIK